MTRLWPVGGGKRPGDEGVDAAGQVAPRRPVDGPGSASRAAADRLVGAAHALRRTRWRFLLVFGDRPHAGYAATQLRLAARLIDMAVTPLRGRTAVAIRAAVTLGSPVGLVALACVVPPSVTSLWTYPLGFTSWCAASWLLGRGPARQRRLVPVRLRRAQLAPRGTPQRLRQEAQLVHDTIRAADRVVRQVLAGLPDPAAQSGPDSRHERRLGEAAAVLRQAQTPLTSAGDAVTPHLAETLDPATEHPGGRP